MKKICIVVFGLALVLGLNAQTDRNTGTAEQSSAVSNNKTDTAQSAEEPNATETQTNTSKSGHKFRHGIRSNTQVVFRHDVELKEGDTAEVVVVIGGNARVHGKVTDSIVAIGGDIDVSNEVGDSVVAVLGNIHVKPGAKIKGDVVAVGGHIQADEGATIEGETNEVELGAIGLDKPEWLRKWFAQCVVLARPLSPGVGWVWWFAGMALLFYALVAVAVPRPVQACVNELTARPATTFLAGLLTPLVLPLVMLVLAITGIGLLVIPFLLAALVLGAILGKVAFLEWIGLRIGTQAGLKALQAPLLALLAGAAILALLYMVPVIGVAVFLIAGIWGLGVVVVAAAAGWRREGPAKRVPPGGGVATPAAPVAGAQETKVAEAATVSATPTPVAPASVANEGADPAVRAPVSGPPVLPDVLAFPRAGFWERMGAGLLDIILVSVFCTMTRLGSVGLLVALAYFAAMWTWKGTTIGGLLLGLKVVRYDGRRLEVLPAVVRGLAAAFSTIVLFLGFLWIVWDPEKLAWHDKIAGTVVLRMPKSAPLVLV